MRSVRVLTNQVCNQNCTYCTDRSDTDPREFIRRDAVEQRIRSAVAEGISELVVTGGEPTMRRDLCALIANARQQGVSVTLESNGTLIDDAMAVGLAAAGLGCVRINLAGWGESLDSVTRDPGGFAATLRGIDACVRAMIPVEISSVLVRSTLEMVPKLPAAFRAHWGEKNPIRRMVVAVPTRSPDPRELLPYNVAVEALSALDRAARATGLVVKLAPDSGPPPCMFSSRNRPTHLYSLTPGGGSSARHARLEACTRCVASDRCAGIDHAYTERWGSPAVEPITEDRVRRRLSLIQGIDEQIRRELVTINRSFHPDRTTVTEEIIRVNFNCNQTCRFCFVSTHLPAATEQAVREAIIAAGSRGSSIVLSGGEPMLNPRLTEYIRLARAHTQQLVQLQTNAVLLDDPAKARMVVSAGLDMAFVSLHGTTAAVSDAVTGAPGTFVRTLVGLDNLISTGVRVVINFVICSTNTHELPDMIQLMASRWPGAWLNISFVSPSTDVVPRDREMIPSYVDVLPFVARALSEAQKSSVKVTGFESMCGMPLCVVPDDVSPYLDVEQIPEGYDGGEFYYPNGCNDCSLKGRCFGVRKGYAALYGDTEFQAVKLAGS